MDIRKIAIIASAAAAIALTGCDSGNGNNGDENHDNSYTASFTTVAEAVYTGDEDACGAGHYSLTLANGDHTLHLEFASSLYTTGDYPVPDEGSYDYAAKLAAGSFSGDSYWVADVDGITRKISNGSFTISGSRENCTVAGKVGGRDGSQLDFSYTGALNFSDAASLPDEDAVIIKGCYGTYYGPYYIPSAADFYIVMYDTVHSKQGDPYSYRICLDFISQRETGSLMPEMGTYRPDLAGDFANGFFVTGSITGDGTMWSMPNESGGDTMHMAVDGSFTIRKEGSSYRLFGTLKDRYGAQISFDYSGQLNFDNQAPGPRTALAADLDFGKVFYANQRCYFRSEVAFSQWKLWFYDEDSWTTKGDQGYFISFDIPLDPDMESIPAGDYTAAAHVLYPDEWNFIGGYMYTDSDALGTWVARGMGDGNGARAWAPVRDGSLSIKDNGDGTMTATFDVRDDDFVPHRITGTYTGAIPVLAGE